MPTLTEEQRPGGSKMVIVGDYPSHTPPEVNMEPENKSLEKESPFGNHYFQVQC